MALEDKIDTLIEAIRSLEKRMSGTTQAAPAAESAAEPAKRGPGRPAKATSSEPKATAEDVKNAAKALKDAKGTEVAKSMIAKHGSAALKDLPKSAWDAFVAEANEAAEASDEPSDDDL